MGATSVAVAAVLVAVAEPAAAATANPAAAAGQRRNATRLSFPVSGTAGLSVDVGSGNGMITDQLLTLPGVVNDVPITLSYNSTVAVTGVHSVVANKDGAGWVITGFDQRIVVNSDKSVTYYGPGGLTGVFDNTGTGNSDYKAPKQFQADLTKVAPGYTLKNHQSGEKLSFDSGGRLSTDEDRNGNKTSYNYDANGVPTSVVASRGATANRTIAVTTSGGRITKLTQTSGSLTRSVSLGYSSAGFLSSVTDAAGKVTAFAGASGTDTGKVATITGPGGAVTTLGYLSSTSGKVVSIAQGNPSSVGGAGTSTTRLDYTDGTKTYVADPVTNQTQSVQAVPNTTYELDSIASALVTKATDQLGHKRSKTYTTLGDTASSTPAAGGTTAYSYGANNGESLTQVASPGGASQTASYGNSGSNAYLPSSTTNDSGNSLKQTYNAAGNQTATQQGSTGPSGKVNYNDDGTPTNSASPGAASTDQTHYGYDSVHQLTSVDFPGTSLGIRNYTYDAFGRLATATTGYAPGGYPTTLTYSYDNLDRITKVHYNDSTVDVTYAYNAIGKITQRVDATGTTNYTYDALGNLTSVANGIGGGTIAYTYDLNRAVKTESTALGTTTYTYDDAHRMTAMGYPDNGGTGTAAFRYDDAGRRTDVWMATYGGTVVNGTPPSQWLSHEHTTYDDSGRITKVLGENGPPSNPTAVVNETLCYAANSTAPSCSTAGANDRSKIQWRRDTVTGETTTYTYNGDDRLTKVVISGGSNPRTYSYGYDDAGNRTSSSVTGTSPSSKTTTYDANNQITSSGYSYDTAGNLLQSPTRSATFNAAGQQTQTVVQKSGGGTRTSTYTYAGTNQNELVKQTGAASGRSYTYYYGRTDKNGLPIIEGLIAGSKNAYVFHDSDGQPVMFQSSAQVTCLYVLDGINDPVAITTNNASSETLAYDPYGAQTRTDGSDENGATTGNPYAYQFGVQDWSTNEVKFGRRWYNPTTAAWTQQDALNAPLDPKNANRYAYAGGDPINNQDPTGRDILGDIVGYVAGVAVGVTCGAVATLATGGSADYLCGVAAAATATATTDYYDSENDG